MCIKDKTTKEERTKRSQEKDVKYRKIVKELVYKDEDGVRSGELIRKNWLNSKERLFKTSDKYGIEMA